MIYLDHAAATPVDSRVQKIMAPYFGETFGNPSTQHQAGRNARLAIEEARGVVAGQVGLPPEAVFFTSGGTEANNWAIIGLAKGLGQDGKNGTRGHIITTSIEHDSVLGPLEQLELEGWSIHRLPVREDGTIQEEELDNILAKMAADGAKTAFASIMYTNNEIGTIQNLSNIAKKLKDAGCVVHTDACQAPNYLPINMDELGVDLMTLNSSKLYGPKGAGALIVRPEYKQTIAPLLYGGGQESRMRAGTENTPAIVGFGQALQKTVQIQKDESARLKKIQMEAIQKLTQHPAISLNGPMPKPSIGRKTSIGKKNSEEFYRLPNNINITIDGISAETMLVRLDMENICASAGSACSSASIEPSHVLLAIGQTKQKAAGALRLTLGRSTTQKTMLAAVDKIIAITDDLLTT